VRRSDIDSNEECVMTKSPVAEALEGADYTRPDAACDMVMKGGITSGVIYPLAVCRLAVRHRLRNIGGTSAGAIAAGLAAAAELGRESGGFAKLAHIPHDVGADLHLLLQPTARTRPVLEVLLAALGPGSGVRRTLAALWAAVTRNIRWFLAGFLVVGAITLTGALGVFGASDGGRLLLAFLPVAVLVGVPVGVFAAIAGLVVEVMREVPRNDFGLVNGMSSTDHEALTPWLHARLEDLAGPRRDPARPLTFGDLWGEGEERTINLEVMTTDVTEGLPYRFPFESRRYAFCPACFGRLFPDDIVAFMDRSGEPPNPGDDGTAVCRAHPTPVPLKHLPDAADFPVLVAVRMSLSFPVLISAVPLYKVDFHRGEGNRNWTRHWFSDGGIGSNFPIHLFDSPWPNRPTYAIDLQPSHPDFRDPFYRRSQGQRAQPRTLPVTTVPGFLMRIMTTMQNWRDDSLSMTPGYSDRIVTIYQSGGEGGLNLRMRPEVIAELAERGGAAAGAFDDFDLDYHRWERYRIAMSELDVLLSDLHTRYTTATTPEQADYEDFVANHATDSYVPSQAWRAGDIGRTRALMDLASSWLTARNPARENAPSPSPVFRMEPRQTLSAD
jgi:predicted acylesterase/phospholipase RssA